MIGETEIDPIRATLARLVATGGMIALRTRVASTLPSGPCITMCSVYAPAAFAAGRAIGIDPERFCERRRPAAERPSGAATA